MQITKHWINEKTRRYYSIFLQQDLLGDWILTRANGGLGNKLGAFKTKVCPDHQTAMQKFKLIVSRRKQHKYKEISGIN